MNKLNFDLSTMIHPQNDRHISAMLDEAIAELQRVNTHLKTLLESKTSVDEHA